MSRNRAFTMIELLMVMLIIGIVMAIVIPALGGARQAARKASTQQVMSQVSKAAGTFQNDAGRKPGFYTPEEMGRQANIDYGLTSMENAMLDLIGGIVDEADAEPDDLMIEIPTTDRVVYVDPEKATGTYFLPDKAYYRAMIEGQQVGSEDHVGEADFDPQLKDVVDAWGNPLLLWVDDQYGPTKIENHLDFAKLSSGADGSNRARFYWASNAGFLRSQSLGKGGQDQTDDYKGSLMREDLGLDLPATMMGVLGNPSYPLDRDLNADEILATAPRGSMVIHSAGNDGIYYSQRDRGARNIGVVDGNNVKPILYGLNFKVDRTGAEDLLNDNGQVTTEDRASLFDDMLISGGN